MTSRYRDRLLKYLDGAHVPGCWVELQHHGAISISVTQEVAVLATPDWDERNTLPVTVTTMEGDILETVEIPIAWTGKVETDEALWLAAVMPIVDRYRAHGAPRLTITTIKKETVT